jgi:uncharacterized membrane protein
MSMELFKESLYVGAFICVIGLVLHYLSLKYMDHDMNNYKIFGLHLFVIGMLGHLVLEWLNVNKMYCKTGNACLNKVE